MMRTSVTLMALGSLALMASAASAQNESRGYGGPLYVGPNFEKGGQHTTPDYGFKSSKKAVIKREVVKPHKAPQRPQKEEVATQKEAEPAVEKETTPAKAETSSTSSPATETAATSGAATCKKFEPTAGQTITVPCQ
jgi:hypothetical protein